MIEWIEENGDFKSKCGQYELELGSGEIYWVFVNHSLVGTYKGLTKAKQRCEYIKKEKENE